jgi:hypothetical protein
MKRPNEKRKRDERQETIHRFSQATVSIAIVTSLSVNVHLPLPLHINVAEQDEYGLVRHDDGGPFIRLLN